MYAIVEIAGQQFKVEKDQQIFVHQQDGNEGDKLDFHDVLLIDNKGKVAVGAPAIDGAKVSGKILRHLKGDKVIVFKKKRRKGYKVRNGHRQCFTEILIESIVEKGAKKVVEAKKEAPKKATAPKAEAKEAPVKAEVKKAETKAAPKKTEAEKPAAKKAAPKKAETKKPAAKKPAAKKAAPKKDNKDKK